MRTLVLLAHNNTSTVQSNATTMTMIANPAKGVKPGERGAGPLQPTGYLPGGSHRCGDRRRNKGYFPSFGA